MTSPALAWGPSITGLKATTPRPTLSSYCIVRAKNGEDHNIAVVVKLILNNDVKYNGRSWCVKDDNNKWRKDDSASSVRLRISKDVAAEFNNSATFFAKRAAGSSDEVAARFDLELSTKLARVAQDLSSVRRKQTSVMDQARLLMRCVEEEDV